MTVGTSKLEHARTHACARTHARTHPRTPTYPVAGARGGHVEDAPIEHEYEEDEREAERPTA